MAPSFSTAASSHDTFLYYSFLHGTLLTLTLTLALNLTGIRYPKLPFGVDCSFAFLM
jgi:hypothetical protein